MSPDVRNFLLVVGFGAIIGLLAVPAPNSLGAPNADPGTAQGPGGSPDQILAELQAQQRARAEALRQQQFIGSATPDASATTRELRDVAVARILASNPSNRDLAAVSAILNGGATAPQDPYPIYSQPTYSSIPQLPVRIDPSPAASGARGSLSENYRSSRYSQLPPSNVAPLDFGPPALNRAGPGTYSDSNGDLYTQAGPRGVVNTRTGEFRPTN